MAGNDTNNSNTSGTRFNGAFDIFADQAATSADFLQHLENIDKNVAQLLRSGGYNASYTNTRNGYNRANSSSYFRDQYRNQYSQANRNGYGYGFQYGPDGQPTFRSSSDFRRRGTRTFEEGILDGLSKGILGFDWRTAVSKGLTNFAKNIGLDLNDLAGTFGENLTKFALDAFKGTDFGKQVSSGLSDLLSQLSNALGPEFSALFKSASGSGGGFGQVFNIFSSMAGAGGSAGGAAGGAASATGATTVAATAATETAATTGGTAVVAGAGVAGAPETAGISLAVAAALIALTLAVDDLVDRLEPAAEGVTAMFNAMTSAANRYRETRKKNLELARKRMQEDMDTLIREPFTILKESAEKVESAWDNALTTITATQGYTKEQTQTLMANIAERLRADELTSVVSAASILEKLPDVLKQGLSGAVAEEFAYQASVLNAAIPTQDFFGYASTYSSIAANAIKDGKSQSEAIQEANNQLKAFANNILYSSRQLAGGFSTGLQNAEQLFEQSVRIAQAGKVTDISQISGVMTAVAGIVGAIAPDLATSLTDAVYQAAIGGNDSSLVALRSLAGVNASNTEFLKQLIQNPKQLFTKLFTNLASMQNLAPGAYMEVADQVSQVFGLSRDAFARVDFNYLANAISRMDVSSTALVENMGMLLSGQTTLTRDQLRNQQINEYMLEEGLSLVLDSDVGRAIQQHMWDEQLAREITQAEFAVNLQGAALQMLEGILTAIGAILNFMTLGTAGLGNQIANLIQTTIDEAALNVDLAQALMATEVGAGHSYKNLLTRNADLKLVDSYVSMVGGLSLHDNVMGWNRHLNAVTTYEGLVTASWGIQNDIMDNIQIALRKGIHSITNQHSSVTSKYVAEVAEEAATTAGSVSKDLINQMLDSEYIEKYVREGRSAEDWMASASSLGISDLDATLDTLGISKQSLRNLYTEQQVKLTAAEQAQYVELERQFWVSGIQLQEDIAEWKTNWTDYYIKNTVYTGKFHDIDYAEILNSEKDATSSAITKLATELTESAKDLSDPAVQTNTILAQILLLLTQLVQQGAIPQTGTTSLESSLIGLALGGSFKA